MGFQCAVQFTGLVMGDPKGKRTVTKTNKATGEKTKVERETGKHRSNGKAIMGEMGKERISASATLNRSLSYLNTYEGRSDSGFAVWDDMVADAKKYKMRVLGKDKKGNPVMRYRSVGKNTVIGCAIIINPPAEVCVGWSEETYQKFYDDTLEILYEFEPDIFREENRRFRAIHRDEGTATASRLAYDLVLDQHMHEGYDCIDRNGHYCGNKIDPKFLSDFNRIYPQKMRERGWDMDDLDVTDWKRYKTDEAYRNERKEKAKKAGRDVNKFLFDRAAEMAEDAGELLVESYARDHELSEKQMRLEQVEKEQKKESERLRGGDAEIRKAFRSAFSALGVDDAFYGDDFGAAASMVKRSAESYKEKADKEAKSKAVKEYNQRKAALEEASKRKMEEYKTAADVAAAEAAQKSLQEEKDKLEEEQKAAAEAKKLYEDGLKDLKGSMDEVKQHKAKAVQDDPSREKFMKGVRYKDGSTVEDKYQAHLNKKREEREKAENRLKEIYDRINNIQNENDGMRKE